MAKYKDPTTNKIVEIASPEWNKEMIKERGLTSVSESTPLGTITSEDLGETEAVDFQTTEITPLDVSGLKVDMTPAQTQAQTQTEELTDLLEQLEGETAFRTKKAEEKDIAGLTKVQREQATMVENLQLEAKRLANQYKGVQDVMQARAEGRGITAGGLAPLTAGEQRKIAIQQRAVASQALTAAAAYNVAQGNLNVAQDAVDRAVAAKYDPIKEEIAIKQENLKLLLGSPIATAQEKAQAEAKQKELDAEAKKVAEQEDFNKTLQNLYVQMAATPDANPADVIAVKKLLAKEELTIEDVGEANRLASPYLAEEEPTPKPEKPLSVLDVQRYNELYPNAGVVAGDTETTANAKVARLSESQELELQELTDENFRTIFRAMNAQNVSFDDAMNELATDPTISNKERGELILREIYGKTEKKGGGVFDFFGKFFKPKEAEAEEKKEKKYEIIPEIEPPSISFFSRLFGG